MPANKKSTNKTAHVLNVITAGRATAEEIPPASLASPPATTAEAVSPPPVIAPPVIAPVVPMVEVEHAPEELSNQIREALREEVERAESDTFSVLQPEVIKTGDYASPSSPSSPAAPPVSSIGRRTPVRSAQPMLAGEPQVPPGTGDESEYVNVMQALVREKVPKYIKLLGVCPCSRCQADVEALALSHLEPKYIVLQKCQRFPYSVYENHYNAAVTSQIISACRVVMENPRH